MAYVSETHGIPRRPSARVLSCGGGLDSFAMLVRSIRERDLPDVVAFCDVGDPSGSDPAEWPGTYKHLREVVMPLCAQSGIEFAWISSDDYPVRDARSLFDWMRARKSIPVMGPTRICTTIAKVERFERWMGDRFPGQEVEVWVGFEAGEESRAARDPNAGLRSRPKPGQAVRVNRFPLIEWGMCRCRCEELVRSSGLPVPRKSACVFCPYGTRDDWRTLSRELPEHFDAVAALEASRPPTKNGYKLSIKGFRNINKGAADPVLGVDYKAPPIREWLAQPGAHQPAKPCPVCGRAERATKAAGCGYLE